MSQDCCNDKEPIQVCFTPADASIAPVTLLQHLKYGTDGAGDPAVVSYISTAADPEVALDPAAYLGGGTFQVGACLLTPPDVEFVELCEKLADGSNKKFIRRSITKFDPLDVPTLTVTDWELDKTTAYAVVDETNVGDCGCEPLANNGLVTDIADFN